MLLICLVARAILKDTGVGWTNVTTIETKQILSTYCQFGADSFVPGLHNYYIDDVSILDSVPSSCYLKVALPDGSGEVYVNGTLRTGDDVGFASGDVANITAVPASGWEFSQWAFDIGTENPLYFTMTENTTAWAIFTENITMGYFEVPYEEPIYVVETCSNSTVSDLIFNQTEKSLRLGISGLNGTSGFCNITVPAELMSGDFTLYLDDKVLVEGVEYTESFNGTHHLFSVNYTHSIHEIKLVSTEVIPDFVAWFFLPFLMTATLLGFALRKTLKKHY
jgi:hypothetical protein